MKEVSVGYVVDVACLRKYPRQELLRRAAVHTRECIRMGHCVESGYGLVDEQGLVLLDDAATPMILRLADEDNRERGVRVRAVREMRDGEMRTVGVEPVE